MSAAADDGGPAASSRPIEAGLYKLTSVLLQYPSAALVSGVDVLDQAVAGCPRASREPLHRFLGWLRSTPSIEVAQHYVQTFDLRRKSGLYLTYYLHGDTRKRGIALLTLKQRYRAHGLRLRDGELPDLLPVVLEFAAAVGPGDGEAPLRQHRHGLELLRAALEAAGSPYRHLLDAVCLALPPITDEDRAAITALAVDGPPVETVGLGGPGGGDELAGIGLAPYGAPAGAPAACTQPEVRP